MSGRDDLERLDAEARAEVAQRAAAVEAARAPKAHPPIDREKEALLRTFLARMKKAGVRPPRELPKKYNPVFPTMRRGWDVGRVNWASYNDSDEQLWVTPRGRFYSGTPSDLGVKPFDYGEGIQALHLKDLARYLAEEGLPGLADP